MSDEIEKGKDPKATDALEIKSDTFKQLSDDDLNDVSGGMMRRGGGAMGTTLNPSSSDGCCGA